MELVDFSRPGEKKKLIWAGVLGLVAILFLWWTFVGFGSKPAAPAKSSATGQVPSTQVRNTGPAGVANTQQDNGFTYLKVIDLPSVEPDVPEPKRNIFAYYERPKVDATSAQTPPPTPTPTPPVLLASISPANVYAKTADFNLEASGDKFTPEMHIFVDGRELATQYRNPQQLAGTISASMIANPGVRSIEVKTPDGRSYSNKIELSVAPPPTPNYSYVGIFGTPTHVDTAVVQDRTTKEILGVQRGDVLSGRFRVTSISDKELVFIDTNLKIKHTLQMTEGERTLGTPISRPTPKVDADDDEP